MISPNETDNNAIDARVLAAIRTTSPSTFSSIRLTLANDGGEMIEYRGLDRALQRLRRAGKVAFDSKTGWRTT